MKSLVPWVILVNLDPVYPLVSFFYILLVSGMKAYSIIPNTVLRNEINWEDQILIA